MSDIAQRLSEAYELHGEKLRYLVVGFCNTMFSYLLFWVAIRLFSAPLEQGLTLDHKASAVVIQWASWVLMVMISTTTMKYFAFRSPGHLAHQIGRAYLVYLPAQGIASLILWASMHFLGVNALVGQLFSVVATTIFSYVGHKYFTFRTSETAFEDELRDGGGAGGHGDVELPPGA